jgi:nitronate monooxygenase
MGKIAVTDAARHLGVRYPIVQGPFGGGLSTPHLTAAVSNRGGLGSFGAHHLAPEGIGPAIAEIRARTSAPFAVNLWVSDHDEGGLHLAQDQFDRAYELFAPYFAEMGLEKPTPPAVYHQQFLQQVEAMLETAPPVFSFVFGIPAAPILEACKRRGIITIGAATSIAEAQALDAAGVDLIVATGMEAGGHRPSFLARAEDSLMGTFALIQLISPRVKAPVIAAGGIVDGRGVRAAMALGAQAAQLGTAFLACEESGTTKAHRDLLFSDAALNTALTRAFSGRLARGMRNRWMAEMASHADRLPPFPVQGWFANHLKVAAVEQGRTDLVALWSGQIAPNIKHKTADLLMDALIADITP